MLTIIVFIIILGVLIFVHELGHFVTAKRNGIRAEEFGFGFPPRLVGFQKLRDEKTKKEKWHVIWGSKDGDDESEKKDIEEAYANEYKVGTIYSLNWIPLGGFVKIKGENGDNRFDEDSFSHKGAWVRIKVLAAGVTMNFILAWVLVSAVFMIGAPEAIDPSAVDVQNSKIQISEVLPGSPAETMGIKVGDEIVKNQNNIQLLTVKDFQDYINSKKGEEIVLQIKRGNQVLDLHGTPRVDAPAGQGALGVSLAQTVVNRYPFFTSLWKGAQTVFDLIIGMLLALFGILKSILVGKGGTVDVSGPVGIAVLTKQVTTLGLVYVLQFTALLSVNLGIINAFPIPALDGGRILFVLIEKIKRSPVTQKTEQMFHTVGFVLLIALMIYVTFRDVIKFVIK